MKIEKLNDHQIRCTLTREDLSDREIQLTELAYGSEKAKLLFRDMMQQAAFEFGFEASEAPLMIEAIPSTDKVVLIVTKVEDPEELDSRFSSLTPWTLEKTESTSEEPDFPESKAGADDILNLVKNILNAKRNSQASETKKTQKTEEQTAEAEAETEAAVEEDSSSLHLTRLYAFQNLDSLILLSKVLKDLYHGASSVFKDSQTGEYFLNIEMGDLSAEDFNRICNICTEYSSPIPSNAGTESYFAEHMNCVIPENALVLLSEL